MAGTGFLFSIFGIGAVLIGGLLLPVLSRLRRDDVAPDVAAQRWIRWSFDLFIRIGRAISVWDWEVRGIDRLRRPATLYVANHPTLMDVVFLLAFMPQGLCVVKREAWRNPALRFIVSSANYIPNDDGDAMIDDCVSRLQAGQSIVLFPEGSRSPERGLRPFKRGAAHVALRSRCPIVPVRIVCSPPALKKGQPWYALPNEKLRYSFDVGEPVHAKDLVRGDETPALAARRINRWLRSYFESRLEHGFT